jgi:hypothetical protein
MHKGTSHALLYVQYYNQPKYFLPVPLFDSRQCQDWTLNFPEGLRMVNQQGALAMAGIQAPEEAHTNSTVRVGLDQTLVILKNGPFTSPRRVKFWF